MSKEFSSEYTKIDQGQRASLLTIADTDEKGLDRVNKRMDIVGDVVGQAKFNLPQDGVLQYDIEVFLNPEKPTLALRSQ